MSLFHPYTIFPLGDSALLIDLGNTIDEEVNRKVFRLYNRLKNDKLNFIKDLVPAYSSLAVYYDVLLVRHQHPYKTAFEIMAEIIENITSKDTETENTASRKIKVPVCYTLKYGPDIEDVAFKKNLTVDEVIQIHTSKNYRIYMLGFLPGFPYMGELDSRLELPRKKEPRLKVTAGSVGITGKQTGIYPMESPGGWEIIGCTPLSLFNKRDMYDPIFFNAGDEVTFYSITEDEFDHFKARNS